MPTYTITLDDCEQKGMEYVAVDIDFWIQNAVHERARLAVDELVNDTIKDSLSKGGSVSGTREEIAMGSTLPSAAERNEVNMQKMLAGAPGV